MAEQTTTSDIREDIGKDEAYTTNLKRLTEEFLQDSLESIRRCRTHFDKMITDAQQHDNARELIANQALQNAVETANMISKQAVRHCDVAIDRQWNVDEVSTLTAKSGVQADAVQAIVTAVLAELAKKGATAP